MYPTQTRRRMPYADEDFYGYTNKDGCLLRCRLLPTSQKGVFCEVHAFKEGVKQSWVPCSSPLRAVFLPELVDYAFTESEALSSLKDHCRKKVAKNKREVSFWEAQCKTWAANGRGSDQQ